MALSKESKRFNLFPIQDQESYILYTKHEIYNWSINKYNFSEDKKNFREADEQSRAILGKIFGFFAPSDGCVSMNIIQNFILVAETYEETIWYVSQLHREKIHALTYGLIIYGFYESNKEAEEVIQTAEHKKFNNDQLHFIESYGKGDLLIKYWGNCLAEGVFFMTKMLPIFRFKQEGKFTNLILANTQILRDEFLHCEYYAMRTRRQMKKLVESGVEVSVEKLYEVAREAYKLESAHTSFLIETEWKDITPEQMNEYVKVLVDQCLYGIGLEPLYNAKSPFPWLDSITLSVKPNFYDVVNGSYKMGGISDSLNPDSWFEDSNKSVEDIDSVDV